MIVSLDYFIHHIVSFILVHHKLMIDHYAYPYHTVMIPKGVDQLSDRKGKGYRRTEDTQMTQKGYST